MSAYYTFEDLSGTSTPVTSDNPYQDLVAACHDDPAQIQTRYNTHRTNRNAQQKAKLVSPDFPGVTVDEILAKLENLTLEPGFKDPRHCLVFWARPTQRIKAVIADVQRRLLTAAPNLWTMPQENLHMTAMEVTHSLTAPEIDALVEKLKPSVEAIADYTVDHRARLIKPVVSFDAQALALSFLPAAGEGDGGVEHDAYTYHHLRRDLFDKIQAAGVKVSSRYVIPSAHLTIGRFIARKDFETAAGEVDREKVAEFVGVIEEINEHLEREFWPQNDGRVPEDGEWSVGEEKGLECRFGTLWYGGGERVYLGKGF